MSEYGDVVGTNRTALPITRREAEVLASLGERLTNQEIAERLHISVRTVESHVSTLLRKIGVAGRRDLTAHALEHAARAGVVRPPSPHVVTGRRPTTQYV